MKKKYIEVKYLEDFGNSKKGDVVSVSQSDAKNGVKEGICEYVKENTTTSNYIKRKTTSDFIKEGKTLKNLTDKENKERKENDSIHYLLLKEDILEIINKEFDKFIVGEIETRKAIFICACGTLVKNLNATFNILINGESSAGKSWITKKVLEIMPKNIFNKNTYRTRISSKALTYWHNSKVEPEWNWDGKILYLEDIGNDILNSDVFKVYVSEGSTATIVGKSKGKDIELPTTYDIEIQGKPITFITTAMGVPIEEIKSRFLMIGCDESEEQTDKIMERQLQNAINGKKEEYEIEIKKALDQLKRIKIVLPDWIINLRHFIHRKDVLRWRREFPRFLEIIKCSAALHQFQREEKNNCLLANEKDYEIARQIIGKISSSSGIEGLTHREKSAYESIKKYYQKNNKGCSRSEIYAFNPIYSDRAWGTLLQKLASKSLLNVKLEISSETNRKADNYYPIELKDISLPSFEELMGWSGSNGSNGMEVTTNKTGGVS